MFGERRGKGLSTARVARAKVTQGAPPTACLGAVVSLALTYTFK